MNKKIIFWTSCGFVIGMIVSVIAGQLIWGRGAAIALNEQCAIGTPDANGCCPGEEYLDLGAGKGFNCCPIDDETADCFPPIR